MIKITPHPHKRPKRSIFVCGYQAHQHGNRLRSFEIATSLHSSQ